MSVMTRIPTAAETERLNTDRAVARLLALHQATEVETIALGTRNSAKRRRRVDNLLTIRFDADADRNTALRNAAVRYRQAWEHMHAGRGLGPMPWGKDEVGDGGEVLPRPLRAISAATCYRVGVQALGMIAAEGVVHWVVIAGFPLREYDRKRGRRRGYGLAELTEALGRLVLVYGV